MGPFGGRLLLARGRWVSRLYAAKEIEQLTGITAATIRAERSKGHWPAPDDTSSRAHRWYGATVSQALSKRRGYHRSPLDE